MNRYLILILLALSLTGCRIETHVEGEGRITSSSGTFDCAGEGGDCSEQYTSPTTETLIAEPAPGYLFSHWSGCNYLNLYTCITPVTQNAIDADSEWTITATFKRAKSPVKETTYTYNSSGQRISKTAEGVTTIFQYDLSGNLLAELNSAGEPLREHIYLNNEPVAQISVIPEKNEASISYIHTDHLGTPGLITDKNQRIVGDIETTPFGEAHVEYLEIDYAKRFPGQYKDEESGLHYNYFRDYDPGIGRYIQSDPIGLEGGINTFAYVGSNPLIHTDPYGLWSLSINGYLGPGGGLNISYSEGTIEVLGRIGIGLGLGASFDAAGAPTPHSEACGSGYIATTSFQAGAALGAKPFAVGGIYTASTGNAVTTPQGGGFQSFSKTVVSPVAGSKLGFGASVSVGANIGSYTNW